MQFLRHASCSFRTTSTSTLVPWAVIISLASDVEPFACCFWSHYLVAHLRFVGKVMDITRIYHGLPSQTRFIDVKTSFNLCPVVQSLWYVCSIAPTSQSQDLGDVP